MGSKKSARAALIRLVPVGSLAGLGTFAVATDASLLALLCGAGAAVAGRRLVKRRSVEKDPRLELRRRARESVRWLDQVAREDRIAAPQMKRLAALQSGVLESWELLDDGYAPLVTDDLLAVVGEVEKAALLARRRSALRRHLESVDRRRISRRVKELEKELSELGADSTLRTAFENALAGRRGELAGYEEVLDGIGAINAQLEGVESLLGNLRGELLAIDSGTASGSLEPGLLRLREQVAYYRRGLDEVKRSIDRLPEEATTERMTAQ